MASLNSAPIGKANPGRLRKTSPRVDLTAMVDLMFLLTTFFMLTTSLSNLNVMDIAKPVDMEDGAVPESRTMTILLGKNNQTAYYMGEAKNSSMKIGHLKLIQNELVLNKKKVELLYPNNPSKPMIVIIKPTETSIFKNFVDVLDEMKIADIKSYLIDDGDLLAQEKSFMKVKGI